MLVAVEVQHDVRVRQRPQRLRRRLREELQQVAAHALRRLRELLRARHVQAAAAQAQAADLGQDREPQGKEEAKRRALYSD